jgi:hypothetical protein
MRVQFVKVSQNAKTGPMPASIVERASCWAGCALYENGCYAETGANAGKNVLAFTHKPVLGDDPVAAENRRLIAAAVEAGFTINLSADTPRTRINSSSWG